MKELLLELRRIPLHKCAEKGLILLDTCFFINVFDREQDRKLEEFCRSHTVAMTSFNAAELLFSMHKLHEKTKDHVRHFLKKRLFFILDIPVDPGNRQHEQEFVDAVDPELLKHVSDPSDAVLIAAAISTGATVMTKDKHHLFTTNLENFLRKYSLRVCKELKDAA